MKLFIYLIIGIAWIHVSLIGFTAVNHLCFIYRDSDTLPNKGR